MKYKKELVAFICSFLITYMAMKVYGLWGVAIAVLLMYFFASKFE